MNKYTKQFIGLIICVALIVGYTAYLCSIGVKHGIKGLWVYTESPTAYHLMYDSKGN